MDNVGSQAVSGGFYSGTCTNQAYIVEGSHSIKLIASGTWNTATFTQITSTAMQGKTLTMKVYNPNAFNLVAGITGYSGYTLAANSWTDITIDETLYSDGVLKFYLGNGNDNVAVAPGGTVKNLVVYIDFVLA